MLRKSPVVEDAFITEDWSLTVTGQRLPEDVQAEYVTSNTFQVFGSAAGAGAADAAFGCDRRAGSAAGGGAGLQVLAAAFQRAIRR